jgi:hypothetical protein
MGYDLVWTIEEYGVVLRPYTRASVKQLRHQATVEFIMAFWAFSSSIADLGLVLLLMPCFCNSYLVLLSAVS